MGSNVFEADFSKSLQNIVIYNLIKKVPILFACSSKDSVVKEEDVHELYNIYNGVKSMSKIECIYWVK